MRLKKFIPTPLKKPFWWLFKAPQRKAGEFTYGVEIKGYLRLLSDKLFSSSKKDLEPITICVSNKNRSEALLNYLSGSILQAANSHLIYLNVYDCGSDDVVSLEKTLSGNFGERLLFETNTIPFVRSIAINRAVKNATTSLIFITDADISLPADIIEKVNFYVKRNRVWFPVCHAHLNKEETLKEWYDEGKGIVACTKQQFENIGGYNETITTWGGEDTDLWFRFWKNKYFCYRTKEKNLVHHWHKAVEGSLKTW